MTAYDHRARLQPKNIRNARDILGEEKDSNILYPLYSTQGVIFPYTPTIVTGYAAEYAASEFVHTNYNYNSYVRSYPKDITITAEFTAQTNDEALYLLAVMHFFRSVTKSYFGVTPYNKAGTPPPVLLFSYMGEHQFNRVPVVVKSFDYTLPSDVDYVSVNTTDVSLYTTGFGVKLPRSNSSGYTQVPVLLTVTVVLDTQYSPIQTRNEFNLDLFRSGHLMDRGFL
jgi:hypothetical protein